VALREVLRDRLETYRARRLEQDDVAGAHRVAVIAGEEVAASGGHLIDQLVDESVSGAENVRRALSVFGETEFLYLTSDLPCVSATALRDFLDRARPGAIRLDPWGGPPAGVFEDVTFRYETRDRAAVADVSRFCSPVALRAAAAPILRPPRGHSCR